LHSCIVEQREAVKISQIFSPKPYFVADFSKAQRSCRRQVGGGGCELTLSALPCVGVHSAKPAIVPPENKNSPCASDVIYTMYNTPICCVRFSVTFPLFAPIPNKVKETVRRDFDKQQGATFSPGWSRTGGTRTWPISSTEIWRPDSTDLHPQVIYSHNHALYPAGKHASSPVSR
jgi:hypothetical protein